jgi:hypothetical protein
MLAALLPVAMEVQAPFGVLAGLAGRDAYMIQSMDNGEGKIDQYINKVSQMFNDYRVVAEGFASMLPPELAALTDDFDARKAHLMEVFSEVQADPYIFVLRREKADQTLLGRATDSGVFKTHEGEISFVKGAYFNRDSQGRVWVIAEPVFERDYVLLQ